MSLLTFEQCCFCVDLRLGCLVIGYINIVGNLILSVLAGFGLRDGLALRRLAFAQEFDLATPMIITNAVILAFTLLFLIFSVMLVYGIHQYKRIYVKAYLIYTVVFLALVTITFFVSLGTEHLPAAEIIKHIVTIVLNIYFLLVIRSYYLMMGNIQTSYT